MGWNNYIVDDKNKIKYEISRHTPTDDIEEIKTCWDILKNEYELLRGRDIFFTKLDDYEKTALMNMGYKIYNMFEYALEHYHLLDIMLLLWLTNREIEYRIISGYELENDPAEKYKTIKIL